MCQSVARMNKITVSETAEILTFRSSGIRCSWNYTVTVVLALNCFSHCHDVQP